MKKTIKRILDITSTLVAAVVVAVLLLAVSACGQPKNEPPAEVTVQKIEVTKLPAQTDYMTGELFSVEGGEITVTYSDGKTEVKKMTDEGVTIIPPDITVEDENDPDREEMEKNVIISFGNKRVTFKINVKVQKYTVVFEYGYDDKTEEVSVIENRPVSAPTVPEREGYLFDKWYSDEAKTIAYEFTTPVTEDMVLYGNWLEDAVYYDFTFDYNHVGSDPASVVNPVKEGEVAVKLGMDPEREGYRFDGWFTAENGGTEYDFSLPVNADTVVYAHWTRVQPMENKDYVFEAEDLNLKGVKGPGASGQASGKSMIVYMPGKGASGDRFVSYLYKKGVTLTFELVSDMDTTATFAISLSAEMRDITVSPNNYSIIINDQEQQYSPAAFTNVPPPSTDGNDCLPFRTCVIGNNIPLKAGVNTIKLVTDNTVGFESTTMTAEAPLVDCLRVTTNAVLTWNNSLGYPADNY